MRRIRLISDDACRKDLGNIGLMRWHRWQRKYADLIPPPVVIENHKFRDAHLWEEAKRKLLALSNPATLREAAHRALAAKKRKAVERQGAGGRVEG